MPWAAHTILLQMGKLQKSNPITIQQKKHRGHERRKMVYELQCPQIEKIRGTIILDCWESQVTNV